VLFVSKRGRREKKGGGRKWADPARKKGLLVVLEGRHNFLKGQDGGEPLKDEDEEDEDSETPGSQVGWQARKWYEGADEDKCGGAEQRIQHALKCVVLCLESEPWSPRRSESRRRY
jgi:hypothetical protein